VLGALSKNLRQMLYERLADSGVVRAERSRILGVVPVHRWPAQDASHEAEVRRLVTQVLVHQVAPDTRIAALIVLLRALECEDKIVDPGQHGLSKRELRARAEKIAEGNWASQAIRKAIEETMAAVLTATTAATIATTASAG
jgi:Golgi phosphoprotein 3 (GPP34)